MKNTKNLVTFLDCSQRTIIAEVIRETSDYLQVINPVVVNITQQLDQNRMPSGAIALQLIPVYFKEFVGDKTKDILFQYNKTNITQITLEGGFDFRVYAQYENLFTNEPLIEQNPPQASAPQQAAQPNTPTLKLF